MKTKTRHFYFKIYKPYGMLSQFTDDAGRLTLANLYNFPVEVYPVGRLDSDSEGLLLLTNDKTLTDLLLNPKYEHEREYAVQVEGAPHKVDLEKLESGVIIESRKTKPAKVFFLNEVNQFPERNPPIRVRKNIPDTWIKLIITEGRNRQVRKMTAAIGFPTLRLIRIRIANIYLDNLLPGDVTELTSNEIKELYTLMRK
jgi:23S rRNA pseudouridine2457 synthase